jgi:hypothetical protein
LSPINLPSHARKARPTANASPFHCLNVLVENLRLSSARCSPARLPHPSASWRIPLHPTRSYQLFGGDLKIFMVGLTFWPDKLLQNLTQQPQLPFVLNYISVRPAALLTTPAKQAWRLYSMLTFQYFFLTLIKFGQVSWLMTATPLSRTRYLQVPKKLQLRNFV